MERKNYIQNPLKEWFFISREESKTSTVHSKYRPFYSLSATDSKFSIYGIPTGITAITHTYKDVIVALHGSCPPFKYISKTIDLTFKVGKGFVLDEKDKFLLLLVAESGKKDKPEFDKLFLSYKFFDSKYKNLYKKVYESMIRPALEEGVPMEVISSEKIQKTVFKPVLKTINDFKTVKEYNDYLTFELDKEFLTEEKIIEIADRDYTTLRLLLDDFCIDNFKMFLIGESYQKVANTIIEKSSLRKNVFKSLSILIEECFENFNLEETDLEFISVKGSSEELPFNQNNK